MSDNDEQSIPSRGSISCVDCFFFKKVREDEDGEVVPATHGECRRYPPVLEPMDSQQAARLRAQRIHGGVDWKIRAQPRCVGLSNGL